MNEVLRRVANQAARGVPATPGCGIIITIIMMVTAMAGCETLFGGGEDRTVFTAPEDGETPLWPFWPTQMRIHPLTRLTTHPDTGEPALEVRLEFKDQYDYPTKIVGQVRIELTRANRRTAGEEMVWNIDLREMATNNNTFDEVTQTYLFRLQFEEGDLPRPADIHAFVLANDGREFQSGKRLD